MFQMTRSFVVSRFRYNEMPPLQFAVIELGELSLHLNLTII